MSEVKVQRGPDEIAFRDDLVRGPYLVGADRGRWRLLEFEWPHVEFAVTAPPRPGAPEEYAFRFELGGYPSAAPTAQVWDLSSGAPLAEGQLPTGGRATEAFNPGWPVPAIYIPTDRLAIAGHDQWPAAHPSDIWDPSVGIAQYLGLLYELLNEPEYSGVREAA
jgi:hypothetical protein